MKQEFRQNFPVGDRLSTGYWIDFRDPIPVVSTVKSRKEGHRPNRARPGGRITHPESDVERFHQLAAGHLQVITILVRKTRACSRSPYQSYIAQSKEFIRPIIKGKKSMCLVGRPELIVPRSAT